jgi:plastocyanin
MIKTLIPAVLGVAAIAGNAAAAEHVVTQQNKAFSVTALSVNAGDKLVFKNEDPFFHNIFSLSEAQTFDLGSFGKGEAREIKLDKPGRYEVECAIHPEMKLAVDVK